MIRSKLCLLQVSVAVFRVRFFVVLSLLFAATGGTFAEVRTLSIYNIHTKETATATFKTNGRFDPEGLKKFNHVMRDWRRDQETRMDPALIDLIWEMHRELGSKEPVHLISGFRSPKTNEKLRHTVGGQARNSRHITGQAADIHFPDVPLKQMRYSAIIRERGGVGYYPASGKPFVHVDTGNVRHWPRLARTELAVLFPKGQSRHVPSDGRPISRDDARIALAKWQASGNELPWALNKAPRPMLASLGPTELPLGPRNPGTPQRPLLKPDAPTDRKAAPLKGEKPEIQLSEEGEEQEDDIAFEPLPATFLLAEKPLSYSDVAEAEAPSVVFSKIQLLMSPATAMASEEFDKRLQLEDLYDANRFKGPAIALGLWRKSRTVTASSTTPPAQSTQ